jgi:predicted secreted protein
MTHTLCKPKLSPSSLVKKSFNCSRSFVHTYCFICACAVAFMTPQEKTNQQEVGIDQNKTTIELDVGEILQIELPGNVNKGFEWRLHELDETISDLTEHYNQVPEKANPGFIGDPNLEHWTFKNIQAGSNTVRILSYQPREDQDIAEKNFYIKTVVKL